MTNFLVYLLLSLPLIGAYAMLAIGIVVVFRASKVLNLAHGAMAMPPAYLVYYDGQHRRHPAGVRRRRRRRVRRAARRGDRAALCPPAAPPGLRRRRPSAPWRCSAWSSRRGRKICGTARLTVARGSSRRAASSSAAVHASVGQLGSVPHRRSGCVLRGSSRCSGTPASGWRCAAPRTTAPPPR